MARVRRIKRARPKAGTIKQKLADPRSDRIPYSVCSPRTDTSKKDSA